MLSNTLLLFAAGLAVEAAVIVPGKHAERVDSIPSCGCTETVTSFVTQVLEARQEPCPTSTVTVFQTILAPAVTVVYSDPASIASHFSYASSLDQQSNQFQSIADPTGNAPETTSWEITHTAYGPAVIATDDPNDGTDLYHAASTALEPVATTTVELPPWDPATTSENNQVADPTQAVYSADHDNSHDGTTTVYVSTVTVFPEHTENPATTTQPSNMSISVRDLQKRQTCSMIFAPIGRTWASWCNNWGGHSTLSLPSTFETTVLITNPAGGEPIPESIYDPSHTLSKPANSMTTSSYEETTSTSTPSSLPAAPTSAYNTSSSASIDGPTSTSTPSSLPHPRASNTTGSFSFSTPTSVPNPSTSSTTSFSSTLSPKETSIVVSPSVTVTVAVTTITWTYTDSTSTQSGATTGSLTHSAPKSTATCGQVGTFAITFEDLPEFSTNNPNDTLSPPIFNPYDHFYWSDGFGYGPPPPFPFAPSDGERLAEYNPGLESEQVNQTIMPRNMPGTFGAGPRAYNNIYSFDAISAYVGCNNTETASPCTISVTGYSWIADSGVNASRFNGYEEQVHTQEYNAPQWCNSPPCQLTHIYFNSLKMSGLSTIRIEAMIDGAEVGFFLDSFEGQWTNNTCEAGQARQSSRK